MNQKRKQKRKNNGHTLRRPTLDFTGSKSNTTFFAFLLIKRQKMLYILKNLVTMVAWKLKFKVHSFREIFALITLITHKRFECVFGSFNKKKCCL
jgi:hypothetical protein